MAADVNIKHVLKSIIEAELDQSSLKDVKTKLGNAFSGIKAEIEAEVNKESIQEYVKLLNKVFEKAKMPSIDISDLQKDLAKVQASFEKALASINNIDTSALKGIETSLEHISTQVDKIVGAVDSGLQKVEKGALKSVQALDKELGKLGDSYRDIQKTLDYKSKGSTEKRLETLHDVYADLNKVLKDSESSWSDKQQAGLKFVKAYEAYYSRLSKADKELIPDKYKDTYNKALPQSRDWEKNLQNLINRREGKSLVGIESEPWAREDTLQEVRDILKNGITVNGDDKTKNDSNKPEKTKSPKADGRIKIYRGVIPPEDDDAALSRKDIIKQSGGGEWWSSKKDVARSYADIDEGGAILVGTISPKNPLVIDAGKHKFDEFDKMPGFKTEEFQRNFAEVLAKIKDGTLKGADDIQAAINARAKELGHDVVEYANVYDTMNPRDFNDISSAYSVLDDSILKVTKSFKQLEYDRQEGFGEYSTNASNEMPDYYKMPDANAQAAITAEAEKKRIADEASAEAARKAAEEAERKAEAERIVREEAEATARAREVESSFDKLDELSDKAYETTDAKELNRILQERKTILDNINESVRPDYENEIESQQQINTELEKRIALLRDAQNGLISVDDIDDIVKETGTLEDKLERLGDVSYDWGIKIKDGEEDEAIDELEAFEETYDRIVLKLANGRKIEILPNAKGLRQLYKYQDGLDSSAYGETEIDDVVFERKKKEVIENQKLAITYEELKEKVEAYYKVKNEAVKLHNAGKDISHLGPSLRSMEADIAQYADKYDADQIMMHMQSAMYDGDPTRALKDIAQTLGVEIPQATEKAEGSLDELNHKLEATQEEIKQTNRAMSNSKDWLKYLDEVLDDSNFTTSGKKEATEQLRDATQRLIDYRKSPEQYKGFQYAEEKINVRWQKAYKEAQNQGVADSTLGRYHTDLVGDKRSLEKLQKEREFWTKHLQEQEDELQRLQQVANTTKASIDSLNGSLQEQQNIEGSQATLLTEEDVRRVEDAYRDVCEQVEDLSSRLSQARKELEEMQKRAEIFGFGADKTSLEEGRIRDTLSKPVNKQYPNYSRNKYIVNKLKDGATLAEPKNGVYGFKREDLGPGVVDSISKTEYEYAKYLSDKIKELNVGWDEGLKILQSQNGQLERAQQNVNALEALYDAGNQAKEEAYEAQAKAHNAWVRQQVATANAVDTDAQETKVETAATVDSGAKVAIDTEALKSVLSSITYNVQIAQKHDAPDNEKASLIDTEALKTVLNSITYNAKIVSDDSDKSANKIAIDESALESTLNRVFGNILNPVTEQNDGNDNVGAQILQALNDISNKAGEHIAQEKTLQEIGGKVDGIKSGTKQSSDINPHYVTNPQGIPVEVYRGIRDNYGGLISNTKHGGTFSTDDIELAKRFAGLEGKIEKALISMKNPLEIDGQGADYNKIKYFGTGTDEASRKLLQLQGVLQQTQEEIESVYATVDKLLAGGNQTELKYYQDRLNALLKQNDSVNEQMQGIFNDKSNPYNIGDTNKFVEIAKQFGYDGVIFKNVKDGLERTSNLFATFREDQIHSIKTLSSASNYEDNNVDNGYALESTLQQVKGVLDNIQANTAKIGTVESTQVATVDANNTLATESTLASIKKVLDTINGKIVKGTKASVGGGKKQTETQEIAVAVPNNDSKASGNTPTERIKTALTSLLKYKTVLQEANQLSGDLEVGINSLAAELSQVADKESLAIWSEHFKQFKNGSSILQTLAKDYRALGEMQAKADNETDPTKLSQYLDNLQILQDRIAVKQVDVNVDDGRFESVYQRAYNITRHQLQQKEELAQAAKQERDELTQQTNVVSTLKKLYTELGTLRERADATSDANLASQYESEADEVLVKIQTLRQSLRDITPELEEEFSSRLFAAVQKEANAQYRAMAKADTADEETRRKKILAIEKEIGKLRAEADSASNSGVKGAINQEVQFREHLIDLQKQGLAFDADMEAYQRRRLALLTKEAKEKERAEKADIKDAFKENEKLLKEQIKQSQQDARYRKVQSAERAGRDTLWQLGTFNVDSDVIAQNANVKSLHDSLNKLNQIQQKISDNGGIITPDDAAELQKATGEVNAHTAAVKQLINSYNMFNETNSVDLNMTLGAGDIKEQLLAAANAAYGAKFQFKSFDETMGTMTGTVKVSAHEFQEVTIGANQLNQQIRASQGVIKKTEGFWESFGRKLNEIFRYFSASSLIYKAFNELRKGIQYIREIDSALTELKKVTDETEATYDRFLNTAAKTADKVGSTVKEIVSSTADWARIGYSLEDAATLAESTAVLLNVSEFQSIDDATSALTSTLQAFSYTAEQSMDVVDVMNEVGNNFAVSSDGIATALKDSASSLVAANNSYQEAVALIAAANKVVQDPGSVGAALRTISLRLRATSTEELEEAGEDTTGAVTSKSKLQGKIKGLTGVDILTETGAYRSTYEILLDISKVWEDMSDIDQAGLLEVIAGKTRSNTAAAILSNTKDLEEAFKSATEAEGSALRENEKYLDSIQGRIDLFNNAVQTMWKHTLDSDLVKDIVNLGTEIVKIIDKVGLLNSAVVAFGAYKGFGALFKSLKEDGVTLKSVWTWINQLTLATRQQQIADAAAAGTTLSRSNAEKFLNLSIIKRLTTEQMDAKVKEANRVREVALAGAKQALALAEEQYAEGLIDDIALQAAKNAVDAASVPINTVQVSMTTALGMAFKGLAASIWGATKAVLAFLFTNPVGWVILAIGAIAGGIAIFNHFHKTTEELAEELDNLKSELPNIQSELESVNSELETTQDRMAELLAMDTLSFTEKEELENLKKQNDELQRKLDLLELENKQKQEEASRKFNETMQSDVMDSKEYYSDGSKVSWWSELGFMLGNAWNSSQGTGAYYHPGYLSEKSRIEQELQAYADADEKEKIEISEYIRKKLGELNTNAEGLDYFTGDNLTDDQKKTNEWLDYINNLNDRWAITSGGDNAKTNAIKRIFNKEEFAEASDEIDKLVAQLEKDPTNQTIIDKISAKCKLAEEDLRAVGLSAEVATEYFTSFASDANFNTLTGKTEELKRASGTFENLLRGSKFKIDVDGEKVDTGLAELFDEEGKVIQMKLSQIFNNTSEQTRKDITSILEGSYDQIKDGLNDAEITNLITNASIRFSRAILEIEKSNLASTNLELFPGLEDEISGIIDTFDELISAVGSVVDAMDILDQARAEEAYSGSVSLETLGQLMQSTENYADLIEVDETGAIKLATNAQDILVQQKIDAIKQNANAALAEAELALQEAIHAEQTYTQTGPAQDFLRKMTMEVGGAVAFVSSLWNDIISGNWDGAWDRAKAAQQASVSENESQYAAEAAEASAAVEEARKNVANAEKMKKIADGLTPENVKERYDSEEASGGTSNKEDAEKKKAEEDWEKLVSEYENKLALITNERDLIEAEIDRVEAQGGKASADYYKDLIRNQNEEKTLLEDNYEKMKLYMDLHKDEVDQDTWTEWNNTLNEMAVGIKECTTNLLEYYDALEELDRHYFDQAIDDISRLGDEIDFVIGLVDDADVAESDGTWTEEGIVQIGMFTKKMEHAAQMTKYYKDELNKVNASWAAYQKLLESATDVNKDGIIDAADLSEESLNSLYDTYGYVITSEEEYKETSNKLTDSMYDSIDAQNEARDGLIALAEARIDAIKEGIEEEIEAYEDYIDVVKEALDAERDLYDFKKNIGKQTKDIAALERRIASLSGSTNAADVAERRKLEAELLEAKEGLNDTYYDHSRDVQSQALDDEAQSFSDAKEKYMEELDLLLEDTETLIQNMILEGILNADVISQFLTNVETQYGAPLSTELTQPWADSSEQARIWKENLGVYIGEVSPFVVNLSDEIKNKLGDGTDSAWTNATNTAKGYADFLTSTDLNNDFSKTLTGFGAQIQKIIDKWNGVKQAANDAYDAQTREVTVGGTTTPVTGNDNGNSNNANTGSSKSVSSANVIALQEVLNTVFRAGLTVDGILGSATTYALRKAQQKIGVIPDGKYGPATKKGIESYIDHQIALWRDSGGPSSAVGQGIQAWTVAKKKLPAQLAKGTLGLTKDKLAITDESWIGEEITLAAGKNGQLQYLKKGSAVMPADISANLVEWGKLNPNMMKIGGGANINMISNAVNSPEIKIDVENFLKVDRVDKDTLPELEKMMDKKIDNLVRQLNYSIKKFK